MGVFVKSHATYDLIEEKPTGAKVAAGRKLDALLRAADDDRLTDLAEVATDTLELRRRHLYNAAVVSFLHATEKRPVQISTAFTT